MRVVIGSDHAGFDQKERIRAHLVEQGHDVVDVGTANGDDSVDYPDFAIQAARLVASGAAELGVLVCGTGIGMSIAANKVRGVRAANVTIPEFASLAREHNNANMVTVSARFIPVQVNEEIVDTFLATPFAGGRHGLRVDKITAEETEQRG
jgi:ribose 5-phosphate isomerase B